MESIYLDNNATTAVAPVVLEAMSPWFAEHYANPSSPYPSGALAADALRAARGEVARLVGAPSAAEIVFTSGGSESIATAFWTAHRRHPERRRLVVSSVEHSATLRSAEAYRELGLEAVTIPVDGSGALDREALFAAIDRDTCLVSLMLANNETGVITDLEGIGRACSEAGVTFHLDAVQGPGKLSLDLPALGCDLASISGHKLHGPKGSGALWVRSGYPFTPLVVGGPQEGERRAGTENVPGCVGLGRAARLAREFAEDGAALANLAHLRDELEGGILERVPKGRVHGAGAPRVANTTFLHLPGFEARAVVLMLAELGVEASGGSACNATHSGPSPVLVAMGLGEEVASQSLRLSLSRATAEEEVRLAVERVATAVETLRALD